MNLYEKFKQINGQFITEQRLIASKLSNIKAFIFDWDGVFNSGEKQANGGSSFSEVDSMGTNLLRYSYFLKNNRLPICGIISGEKNESAFYFSSREGFDFSFFKIAHKHDALNFICKDKNIKLEEVAYFFDDVLDLSIAKMCGLKILIHRKSNPLFTDYCIKNNLVDYITGSESGRFAIREASELLIGLANNYDSVIVNRTEYTDSYETYIQGRKLIQTKFYTLKDNSIEECNVLF